MFGRSKEPWALARIDAYVDGELLPAERARFESLLTGDPVLQQTVESRREARAFLSALPMAEAPRSFRLTAAMAAKEGKLAPAPRLSSMLGLSRTLAGAGAGIAAFFFAVFVVADLGGTIDSGGDDDDSASPASLSAPAAAGAAESSSSDSSDDSASDEDGTNIQRDSSGGSAATVAATGTAAARPAAGSQSDSPTPGFSAPPANSLSSDGEAEKSAPVEQYNAEDTSGGDSTQQASLAGSPGEDDGLGLRAWQLIAAGASILLAGAYLVLRRRTASW